ncbi:hypothetical protein H6503_06015 [Candidatus Woesearchaeota archaeon]|nr:hypothetical protein [Candidatus Woesearchaeota archaeon]
MLDEPKYWISLITGLIATFLSGIPLLNSWKLIKWNLPFALESSVLLWVIAVVGAYLLIDSFLSEDDMIMWISAGIAAIILILAIIQILFTLEILSFGIPFLGITALRVLFLVEGLGLIIAGFGSK